MYVLTDRPGSIDIEDVTAGHIHYGVKGENGPVIVTLFKYETPMNEVSESGTHYILKTLKDNLQGNLYLSLL